jgi:hypothetical protein
VPDGNVILFVPLDHAAPCVHPLELTCRTGGLGHVAADIVAAWVRDVGPFDNDDASDWAFDFDGLDVAGGLRVLVDALAVGERDDYIEATDGANAIAAAAVVTWMRDLAAIPTTPYGEAAATWLRTARPIPTAELLALALSALDRVRSDRSELAALWAEGGDAAWQGSLAHLEARLRT